LTGLPHFVIVTDSNPLVPVLNNQRLDQVKNDRLLKLKTSLARYSFEARWQSGAKHVIADAFSRAPVHEPKAEDMLLTDAEDAEREFVVQAVLQTLVEGQEETKDDGSRQALKEQDELLAWIRQAGQRDEIYQDLIRVIFHGWPDSRSKVQHDYPGLTSFYAHRSEMYVHDGLVLRAGRLFIPASLRKEVLRRLHLSHQGVNLTTERASRAVWWPGMAAHIKDTVERCTSCRERLPSQTHEPLQHGPDAQRPFEKLHADLFVAHGIHWLAVADEFTGWPYLVSLGTNTTSAAVKKALRDIFATHGAPIILKPDGGPQLVSEETRCFLAQYGVKVTPSSPHLPRTNGRAEAMVKKLKKMVLGATKPGKKRPDEDELVMGMLGLRNTPRYGGQSPAELLLGQNVRDGVPAHWTRYDPKWKNAIKDMDDLARTNKGKVEAYYEARSKRLTDLKLGDHVWIQAHNSKRWTVPAKVVEIRPNREFNLRLPSGRIWTRARPLLRKRVTCPGGGPLPQAQAQPPIPQVAAPPQLPQQEEAAGAPTPPGAARGRQGQRQPRQSASPSQPRRSERIPKLSKQFPETEWVSGSRQKRKK
jgi:Integrase zinc binding domain/Integrase core domain